MWAEGEGGGVKKPGARVGKLAFRVCVPHYPTQATRCRSRSASIATPVLHHGVGTGSPLVAKYCFAVVVTFHFPLIVP